jgi:hypothetical protein
VSGRSQLAFEVGVERPRLVEVRIARLVVLTHRIVIEQLDRSGARRDGLAVQLARDAAVAAKKQDDDDDDDDDGNISRRKNEKIKPISPNYVDCWPLKHSAKAHTTR